MIACLIHGSTDDIECREKTISVFREGLLNDLDWHQWEFPCDHLLDSGHLGTLGSNGLWFQITVFALCFGESVL